MANVLNRHLAFFHKYRAQLTSSTENTAKWNEIHDDTHREQLRYWKGQSDAANRLLALHQEAMLREDKQRSIEKHVLKEQLDTTRAQAVSAATAAPAKRKLFKFVVILFVSCYRLY